MRPRVLEAAHLSADRVKLLVENLQLLTRQAFATDAELTTELLPETQRMSFRVKVRH